jgi:hypothetical protein
MRELPEPEASFHTADNGYWIECKNGTDMFTRDQVLAIQKKAYEDGLRYAAQRRTSKLPGTLEILMEYHLPEKTLAVTQLLSPKQLSHAIAPHLIIGADAERMYLHIEAMLTASQKEPQ